MSTSAAVRPTICWLALELELSLAHVRVPEQLYHYSLRSPLLCHHEQWKKGGLLLDFLFCVALSPRWQGFAGVTDEMEVHEDVLCLLRCWVEGTGCEVWSAYSEHGKVGIFLSWLPAGIDMSVGDSGRTGGVVGAGGSGVVRWERQARGLVIGMECVLPISLQHNSFDEV